MLGELGLPVSQQGQGQAHDKGRNRPGQGHGSRTFTVPKRRASARQGARTRAGARRLDFTGTEATSECRLDFFQVCQGHGSSIFTVWKRHASAPWIFSECALNAKPDCTLDSAPKLVTSHQLAYIPNL